MPDQRPEKPLRLVLTLPPKLIFIMLLMWGALVAAYIIWPTYRETIVCGAVSLGALGALAGAFYLARGLILTAQQQEIGTRQKKEEIEISIRQKKAENSLRYLERWNNPQFHYVKSAAAQVIEVQEKEGLEAVMKKLDEDSTFRLNVIDVLNFFEEMAIVIDEEIVDEEILRKTFKGLVHLYWMALKDFANKRRDRFQNPRIFIKVENLHNRWR